MAGWERARGGARGGEREGKGSKGRIHFTLQLSVVSLYL